MVHGTPEQRSAFLPPIVRAEVVWCQGFSEPDAGSDLANVRCRIIDRSDHLILEGSKIWTTQADQSDWCFALVRNDGQTERHRNLSFVLVDMNREGISIQPLVDSTGRKTFNQVFFDGVRVENEHMVGKPGDGWQVAMTTLAAERSYAQMSRYREYLVELERLGGLLCKAGGPDIGSWTREYGAVRAAVIGIRNLSYKITSLAAAGEDIGVLPSIAKFWWSTTHQRLVELGYEVAAETGTDVDYWFERFLAARGETIYAGSSQIQLNIISERGLGLPR
jgi:alkylation response protein AidB-like acyl-CoA dehydrogenase